MICSNNIITICFCRIFSYKDSSSIRNFIINFNWFFSSMGLKFSFKKDAFSLPFGLFAKSQCCLFVKCVAFLNNSSFLPLFWITAPPQWSKCKCVKKTSVISDGSTLILFKDLLTMVLGVITYGFWRSRRDVQGGRYSIPQNERLNPK